PACPCSGRRGTRRRSSAWPWPSRHSWFLATISHGLAEPTRGQDDAEHHDGARGHGGPDRLRRHSVARGSDEGPGRERHVENRGRVDAWSDSPLDERGQDVEEDPVHERGRGY